MAYIFSQVVVVDDLSNSMCGSLKRVCDITSRPLVFYKCDIRDLEALRNVFRQVREVNIDTRENVSYLNTAYYV